MYQAQEYRNRLENLYTNLPIRKVCEESGKRQQNERLQPKTTEWSNNKKYIYNKTSKLKRNVNEENTSTKLPQ